MKAQFSRPPIERMQRIHRAISDHCYPNCSQLALDLEVSTKTIQRDITFMRDRLALPIEYDDARFGYYYTAPVTAFPTMEVSEGELIALFVAQKALEQYRDTPYENALRIAFKKLTSNLNEKIEFRWNDLEQAISFRGFGTPASNLKIFSALSNAVLQSREILFHYQKLGAQEAEERRVHPYHLACIQNQWYLFAFDLKRNELRTFTLPRISKVKLTKATFEKPADFKISEHLEKSFGVFIGAGEYDVCIHFTPSVAQLIQERVWHPSQKIRPLTPKETQKRPSFAGGIELSMKLGTLHEVASWILSWGGEARVIGPKPLVERIKSEATKILDNN